VCVCVCVCVCVSDPLNAVDGERQRTLKHQLELSLHFLFRLDRV